MVDEESCKEQRPLSLARSLAHRPAGLQRCFGRCFSKIENQSRQLSLGIQSYRTSGTVRTETIDVGARRVQSYLLRRYDWIPRAFEEQTKHHFGLQRPLNVVFVVLTCSMEFCYAPSSMKFVGLPPCLRGHLDQPKLCATNPSSASEVCRVPSFRLGSQGQGGQKMGRPSQSAEHGATR